MRGFAALLHGRGCTYGGDLTSSRESPPFLVWSRPVAEFAASETQRGTRTLGLLTDAVVVAYALWTIVANAVVIAGGTASTLMFAAGAALALAGLALALALSRERTRTAY